VSKSTTTSSKNGVIVIKLGRSTLVALCVALACAVFIPATASALQVTNEEGADVHSSPAGRVIGWVEVETEVTVLESADNGIWCNVKFDNGPNRGNGGWVLCGDLGDGI
jgi:hypothetical protein